MHVSHNIIRKYTPQYYKDLKNYAKFHADTESTTEMAFKSLLKSIGDAANCVLLKNYETLVNGKQIIPDGIIRGEYGRYIGYWEAKDTEDKLDDEIYKKLKKGYPRSNTIFEDTQTAVLYQDEVEYVNRFDLSNEDDLTELLYLFFNWNEPQRKEFHKAVEEFKKNIPNIGDALTDLIKKVNNKDKQFYDAITEFIEVCSQSFHKDVHPSEVIDMLVQHLLTERIFRKVFDNPDFVKRNVIARQLEKLVTILTKNAFNRSTFFKEINFFYNTIEEEATKIQDYTEKQSFLNEIYELFFQSYSKKNADKNGVVYTPQPIVKFMVKFTNSILKKEFGKTLSSKGVKVIDPCVGTGNFILEVMNNIKDSDLKYKYQNELFCNELMLLPYYIASVNIEYLYYQRTGEYEPFENIVFTNTLELIEDPRKKAAQQKLEFFFNEANTERAKRELEADLMVIIGNPPYNASQSSEMENNKNTKNEVIDMRIANTYAASSKAQLRNKLYDPYVKFVRWASDRLNKENGIVCFITNNSFMFDTMFDGMRKHLLEDFDRVYHFDLGGDVYLNPKLSGTTHNVFGIKIGVGITFFIRNRKYRKSKILYRNVDQLATKEEKYEVLGAFKDGFEELDEMGWTEGFLDTTNQYSFDTNMLKVSEEYEKFMPLYEDEFKGIFQHKYPGLSTNRTEWVYDFDKDELESKMKKTIKFYNGEVDRLIQHLKQKNIRIDKVNIDDFVKYEEDKIKWSDGLKRHLKQNKNTKYEAKKVKLSLLRPFTHKYLYYDVDVFVDRPSYYKKLMKYDNRFICTNGLGQQKGFSSLMTNLYPEIQVVYNCQVFPQYINRSGNKVVNISPVPFEKIMAEVGDKKINKEDVFYYVYGITHHPVYRARYKALLKSSTPRVPILKKDFKTVARIGKELAAIHLNYTKTKLWPVKIITENKKVKSYNIEKMKISRDKSTLTYNKEISILLPDEAFTYKVNGRSPVEWIVDQYKDYAVETDEVIKLIRRCITVTDESQKLIDELCKITI